MLAHRLFGFLLKGLSAGAFFYCEMHSGVESSCDRFSIHLITKTFINNNILAFLMRVIECDPYL